ncbi:unnamed protein product [Phytophthora fragariaefolia]|uniref:Unnamed protein product n=1 Tax=Phytophthora fragariaefolia TaxID=1490495 RepID=A0A9W6XWW0_9STRA|nr:unnamed protein product [Phytophthora fragariaefolia]
MVRLAEAIAALSFLPAFMDPVLGFGKFVAMVPNGDNVAGVTAIGHVNVDGGGPRNAFGKDFDDMGQAWTTELCEADSDGDGQTNGEELGDPCCQWNEETASTPLWTKGVSNPGDDSSTSDKSSWSTYECSNANSTSSSNTSVSSSSSSQVAGVGDKESATAAGTTATSVGSSTGSNSTTTSGASTVASSAIGGIVTLLFALTA